MRIFISYHQQFQSSLLRLRYMEQTFSRFFKSSLWSYVRSKTLSGNFMLLCGRGASFFLFNGTHWERLVFNSIKYRSTEMAAELAASELFHTFTRSVKFYTFYYQFRCLKSQQKEHRFFWKTVLGILKIALRLRDRRVFMLRSLKILNILAL